jgi:hypothetical protein
MAYGFGSGVRAELGATDYSNYLRGALAGAQMQAQGGAAIGAGVQNALAGVGEGIQKFQQNQQEIAAMAGDVKGMTQANPYLLESLDPKQMKVLESIRDGDSVKKKDMLEVYGAISAQNKMAQQQLANRRTQSEIDVANFRIRDAGNTSELDAKYKQANLTAFNAAMNSEDPQNRAEIYMKTMSDLGVEPDMQVASELRLQVPPGESSDTYSQTSAYTDESGNFIGYGVVNKNTGQLMLSPVGGGPLTEMPEGSIPSTLAKASGSPVSFETFSGIRRDLMDKKRTIARMEKYLQTQGKTEKGFDRMANAFTGAIKTLMGKGLSEAEIQQQLAAGELQGIVGLVRESVGGPGVMTEGDVARILDYLGGSVSALQDPEVVKRAIAGAMMNTYREYLDALPDYDYLLQTQFGSKYDPMEAPELSTEMKAILIAQGLL